MYCTVLNHRDSIIFPFYPPNPPKKAGSNQKRVDPPLPAHYLVEVVESAFYNENGDNEARKVYALSTFPPVRGATYSLAPCNILEGGTFIRWRFTPNERFPKFD